MQSTSFSKECFKKMVIEALREVSDASCLRYDTDQFSVVSRDGKDDGKPWRASPTAGARTNGPSKGKPGHACPGAAAGLPSSPPAAKCR
jgi:hypothetical protein